MKTVGVVGSGNMGRGIAQCSAQFGYSAVLYDISQEQLDRAKAGISASLQKRVDKAKMTAEQMAAASSAVSAFVVKPQEDDDKKEDKKEGDTKAALLAQFQAAQGGVTGQDG